MTSTAADLARDRLLAQALEVSADAIFGEDIVIAKNGRPRARLVPVSERSAPRVSGRWAGSAVFQPGWDDDLTDDFEDR